MGGGVLLIKLLYTTALHYAAGLGSTHVGESIGRVVNLLGTALAVSVAGLVASLVVTAVVVRRQRS